MMLLLSIVYCGSIWLVFAKLKLLRLSLPLACLFSSIGPIAILSLLFCMQYFHPSSSDLMAFREIIPITPQLSQPGRVTEILVRPNVPVKKGQALFSVEKTPYVNAVSQFAALLAESEQQVKVAKAEIPVIEATNKRAKTDLDLAKTNRDRLARLIDANAVSQKEFDVADAAWEAAEAATQQGDAALEQARLSIQAAISQTEKASTQLADAKYDLEQTTVVAPADGFVTNLALQPGMLVGGALGPVMTFVVDRDASNKGVVVALFKQKNFLLIEPGQYSEVVLKDYPGQIFKGRVLTVIDASGAGQMPASGSCQKTLAQQSRRYSRFASRLMMPVKCRFQPVRRGKLRFSQNTSRFQPCH